jgi:hypothetical protein
MKRPDQPEHHFRYDPDKTVAYTATALAWVGDVAAEEYARELIRRLAPSDDVSNWPRRVASANIDLSLALLVGNRKQHLFAVGCNPRRTQAFADHLTYNQLGGSPRQTKAGATRVIRPHRLRPRDLG